MVSVSESARSIDYHVNNIFEDEVNLSFLSLPLLNLHKKVIAYLRFYRMVSIFHDGYSKTRILHEHISQIEPPGDNFETFVKLMIMSPMIE